MSSMGEEAMNLHHPDLELIDPTPDIHALFAHFNQQFFSGVLGGVTVEWSNRMTSCAGLCYYLGRQGGCRIKLSKPLLTLRPRTDLVDTLLHEMIHAYFFVKNGFTRLDRDGHGPDFQQYMRGINEAAGTKITVYHTFHDEVDHHRRHWWKCTGPCVTRPPFYGLVKRAMNRAPGPNDLWWSAHQASCSGSFVKIKEPEAKPVKIAKRRLAGGGTVGSGAVVGGEISSAPLQPITNFFVPTIQPRGGVSTATSSTSRERPLIDIADELVPMEEPITLSDSDDDDNDSELRKAIALSLGSNNRTVTNGQSSSSSSFDPRPSTSHAAVGGGGGPSTSSAPITQVFQSVPFPPLRQQNSSSSTTSQYNFPGVGHRLGS